MIKFLNKKIILINSVNQGGLTYLEYLKPIVIALTSLKADFTILNMPTHCNVSNEVVKEILGHEVLSIDMKDVPHLKADVVISNDAYLGRFLDDDIEALFVSHGATGMPTADPFYNSAWVAYWDGILVSSTTSIKLSGIGMSIFRNLRKNLKIPTPKEALRSDLRSTFLYQTAPIKAPTIFDLSSAAFDINRRLRPTIGILPSQMSVTKYNSIFYHLSDLLSSLKRVVPEAEIILRPYPADLAKVAASLRKIELTGALSVDDSGMASHDFYSRCHIMITDFSTGGVSFMIRRGLPAIHFLPKLGNGPIEQGWFNEMSDNIFLANTLESLEQQITLALHISEEDVREIVHAFVKREFILNNSIEQFLLHFLQKDKPELQRFVKLCISSSGTELDLDSAFYN